MSNSSEEKVITQRAASFEMQGTYRVQEKLQTEGAVHTELRDENVSQTDLNNNEVFLKGVR